MHGWTEAEVDAEVERVWEEHREEQCLVSWQIFSSLAYVQVHNIYSLFHFDVRKTSNGSINNLTTLSLILRIPKFKDIFQN